MDARYLVGAGAGVAVGALVIALAGPFASAQGARQNASNTVVACEPSQRVVVRHFVDNGELQVATECVGPAGTPSRVNAGYVDDGGYARMAQPVSTVRAVSEPRVTAAQRTVATQAEPKRSWKKTALVIGGSAGAGAGVGAIAGGKKGALIGAAIGGGAASIYEAIKR
jgi:hypothetical protein